MIDDESEPIPDNVQAEISRIMRDAVNKREFYKRQVIWFVIGIYAMLVLVFVCTLCRCIVNTL